MEHLVSRLDHALNKNFKTLFIFDIDSTIFNVSPRNQAIFNLYLDLHKQNILQEHKDLARVKLKPVDWGLEPYTHLISDKNLKKQIKDFWARHFFGGTFLSSDRPYSGILELISFLGSKGEIMYLTGRDNHRMRAGTLQQLKYWKLPSSEASLITKPDKDFYDEGYKRNEIKKLIDMDPSRPVFFFDNEASVLKNCFFPEHKDYTAVFIESTHSQKVQPQKDWITLNAFKYEVLLKKLKGL